MLYTIKYSNAKECIIMILLKTLRKKNNLTQAKVAAKLGITQAAYAMYENGDRNPPIDMVDKLADIFDVSVDYLLGRTETPEPDYFKFDNIKPVTIRKIPVLGEIACGKPIYIEREYYTVVGTEIKADFILIAKGDSMIDARIHDGDLVFIRRQHTVNNGEIAAVRIGDEATLKRVYYYPDKQKLVLNPANSEFEPLVYVGDELTEVEIMGKAIAYQSDIK